ncbi:hypothetical protein BK767_17155 [Bacillus thuringiensis serovar kyushuensis]|uniref:hypothetical protein n=1 Tax=Bacillus thuringiensis TaxID=1428 RepID=UPI000B43D39B|nr:hypothetical protein [Bacillus thuringiensis]MEC2866884.1 hypothetical protein [Bacillus cereus]OTZ71061.1 hypothetical protein BK767_17155 [Bacillus thuringiensis serovar kyushuensis]OTZ71974.1 hypothetical protein BK768_19505 [Bacillus thuringiensis serovar tohokuensis]OUB91082.1 hypothetical protein BK773_13690 [Bacillus thuringiensis serovar indiana]
MKTSLLLLYIGEWLQKEGMVAVPLKQMQESNNDNIHESLQKHKHIHDNFTEQFLKQILLIKL